MVKKQWESNGPAFTYSVQGFSIGNGATYGECGSSPSPEPSLETPSRTYPEEYLLGGSRSCQVGNQGESSQPIILQKWASLQARAVHGHRWWL